MGQSDAQPGQRTQPVFPALPWAVFGRQVIDANQQIVAQTHDPRVAALIVVAANRTAVPYIHCGRCEGPLMQVGRGLACAHCDYEQAMRGMYDGGEAPEPQVSWLHK